MRLIYKSIPREVTLCSLDLKKTKHNKSPDTNKHIRANMWADAYQCVEDDKLQFAKQYLPDD